MEERSYFKIDIGEFWEMEFKGKKLGSNLKIMPISCLIKRLLGGVLLAYMICEILLFLARSINGLDNIYS